MGVESSDQSYNDKKYILQTSLLQTAFHISDEQMDEIMQGENAKDPRLAKMLEWVNEHSASLNNALLETPEPERSELFVLLDTDKIMAAEQFLSTHPEFKVPDDSAERDSEELLH